MKPIIDPETLPPNRVVMIGIPCLDGTVTAAVANILSRLEKWGLRNGWAFAPFILSGVYPRDYARNKIAKVFLEDSEAKKCGWLLWLDADMAPRNDFPKFFDKVAQYEETHDIFTAFTLCLNVYKEELIVPLLNPAFTAWAAHKPTEMYTWVNYTEDTDLIACGFGVCLIRRSAVEDQRTWAGHRLALEHDRVVEDGWLKDEDGVPAIFRDDFHVSGKVRRSEDVQFSLAATNAGYKVKFLGNVFVGHYKNVDLVDVAKWAEKARDFGQAQGEGKVELA